MFKHKVKLALTFLTLVAMTGCSGLPKQQAYNQQANTHVKKVAIVKPITPEEVNIYYHNHPGYQAGLIGGIAAGIEFTSKTNGYNEAIANQSFNPSEYLVESLQKALEDRNYDVSLIETSATESRKFMQEYPKKGIDAVLDNYFYSYGYTAGSPIAAYKPTIKLQTRLVDSNSEAVLYANQLATGENFGLRDNTRYIGHSENFSFPSYDALKESPESSIDGLKDAINRIVSSIVQELAPIEKEPKSIALNN
ncbi:hypothetical protein [Marinobacterium jannaschii]|uniref:hypothetical protein n=1 Tax=Marinobacterium jannaschii TaxID=64970 RepID=UPI000488F7DC|nr:hypothetical protein [Marinobacterium jannaschii]